MAKRTANGLNEIRKLINVEMKYIESNTQSATTQNGTITYLCGIGQGDDFNGRDGDSVRVVKFQLNGCVFRSASSTANEAVRIMVVRDLQNAGSAPSGGDILETLGTALAPYQHLDGLNGPDYNNRFTVVYDELFTINASDQNRLFRFESDHACHIKFRGTTNGTSSAGSGSYWLLAVSNSSVNTPTVDFVSRITYTDN